jgi:hypothetical protein
LEAVTEAKSEPREPIDQMQSPQKGVAVRVIGVAIMLPLTWLLLSFVESVIGQLIGAVVVAIVAVSIAVGLGSQRTPKVRISSRN